MNLVGLPILRVGPSFRTHGPRPNNAQMCLSHSFARLKKCPFALRSWRKNIIPLATRESNCRLVINLLDYIEENRLLSPLELFLRRIIIKTLHRIIREKMMYRRIRSKIRSAIDGDENSKFFYASASHRHRHPLSHGNQEFFSRSDKISLLTTFYSALLGTPFIPSWNFNLDDLYPPSSSSPIHLDSPFTG